MLWLGLTASLVSLAPQDAQSSQPGEARLVVSSRDDQALRRLQDLLSVRRVEETSLDQEVWTIPQDEVGAAFAALQRSRAIDGVDYAGDDHRTLFIDVADSFLNTEERSQLVTIQGWPGVEDVRLQRPRQGGLSSSLLQNGFGRVDGLALDNSFLLDLPGRQRLLASGMGGDMPGAFEWRGEVSPSDAAEPDTVGDATLTLFDEMIEGSVVVGDDLYLFTPLGNRGLQAVSRFKIANLPRDHEEGSHGGALPGEGPVFADAMLASGATAVEPALPAPVVITVGVVWTDVAETEARKSEDYMSDRIEHAISDTNFGLERSGASFRLRLTDSRRISGPESTSFRGDVLALMDRDDGRWDDVHAWRDRTRSDIVILIRASTKGHCGEAAAINAGSTQAFSVVSYFCTIASHSLSHEIGHLLGARHIVDNETTNTPEFARGYVYGSEWRTIMVESQRCVCGRINHWANPAVQYRGVPTGVQDQNHDLRVINANAARVAAFR